MVNYLVDCNQLGRLGVESDLHDALRAARWRVPWLRSIPSSLLARGSLSSCTRARMGGSARSLTIPTYDPPTTTTFLNPEAISSGDLVSVKKSRTYDAKTPKARNKSDVLNSQATCLITKYTADIRWH